MGTDISLHVEIKINGVWRHWATLLPDRDYQLFEFLAGVRGEPKNAVVPPRGIPEDATFETRFHFDYDGRDAHTPSWIGPSEIVKLEEWWDKNREMRTSIEHTMLHRCYLFGNTFAGFIKFPQENVPGVEDVRFVFWFDC